MQSVQKSPIPKEIVETVEKIEKSDFKAFLVGGCVRDIFLGRTPKDWDIATDAHPQDIQGLFTKTVYENMYGTVAVINEEATDPTLRNVEITPFRIESGYSDKRRPDQVIFSKDITDDLKRRDFTINAIAVNLSKGAIKDIIDLYEGFKDIKDKVVRTVGDPVERFTEDGLRIMRAIRLAVELGFTIEKETFTAIQKYSSLIKDIALERVRDEFTKIILSAEPKRGLELLHATGILAFIVPELEKAIGVEQNQAHAYDVWEHLLRSLQHAADKNWGLDIRLIALFHDIAKPQTRNFSRETKQFTFYGHEVVGSRETRQILTRLKFPTKLIDKVVKLVRWHMFFSDTEQISLSAVRRMITNVGRDNIWDLMNVRICDRIGTGRPKENPYRLRKYHSMIEEALRDPISVSMLKVDGKALMDHNKTQPGPKIGYVLHALLQEVLEDPKLNTHEYLLKKSEELFSLDEKTLKELGEKGKEKREVEDDKKLEEIRKRHHVS